MKERPSYDGPISDLYKAERRLRAVVDCVLEGHLGEAVTDNWRQPRVARLTLGCYAIFAGDPYAPCARSLIQDLSSPLELLVPRATEWVELISSVKPSGSITKRQMQAYSPSNIRLEKLREQACAVPHGFEIRKIDAVMARKLDHNLSPHGMETTRDPVYFAKMSGGLCALRGERMACAATNYAFSSHAIEVAIATHPDYRGIGLATCVAARWVLTCMEANKTPHWNAFNPISKRLAARLGYIPTEPVDILYLGS